MQDRYRRAILLLEALVVTLVAGLVLWQFAALRSDDREVREALTERANLAVVRQAMLALGRQQRALLEGEAEDFGQQAREFNDAVAAVQVPAGTVEAKLVGEILAEQQRFAREAARALSVRPRNVANLNRLDREAGEISAQLEKLRQLNPVALQVNLLHAGLMRSAVATVITVSLAILLLLGGSFAMLNRLSYFSAETEALAAADRVRTEFVSFISHELRNYLAILQSGLSVILDEKMEATVRREAAQALNRSVGNLSRLVLNLLAAGRAGSGRLEPVLQPVSAAGSIAAAADRMLGYQEDLARRLRLSAPEALRVMADPDYLVLILSNLLDNARKFSPEEAPIEVTVLQTEGQARFTVRDHGPGIAPDLAEKVFRLYEGGSCDPGRRTGTGIGLYLCKVLVEAQHGKIELHNAADGGCSMSFALPAAGRLC